MIDDKIYVAWQPHDAEEKPRLNNGGIFNHFVGAALTGHAFDRILPRLGMWLVTIACWLFAISTILSWYYYGEQSVVYLVGEAGIVPFKLIYCLLILMATLGYLRTDAELDALTALGTGMMLFVNIPIMLLFGAQTMRAYRDYLRRFRAGAMASPPTMAHGYSKSRV